MKRHFFTRILTVGIAVCFLFLPETMPSRAADNDVVKLIFNPNIYDSAPLMVAIDRGYFTEQHLDVQVTKTPQSMGVIIPLLARGDVDVAPTIITPAFLISSPADSASKCWHRSTSRRKAGTTRSG